MKKKLLITGGVLLVLLAAMFFGMTNGLAEGARVPINGIDLSDLPDGSYTGVYEFKRWSNTLVVTVEGHKITAIAIEKDMPGAQVTDCAGELFRRVIAQQDTKIDAVASATVSSKAYLRAIENALEQEISP